MARLLKDAELDPARGLTAADSCGKISAAEATNHREPRFRGFPPPLYHRHRSYSLTRN